MSLQNAFQPEPFVVTRDLPRHADMVDRRHVDQETSRKSDVRSNARALLPQWLLGDLYDDFLPLLEQIANGWTGGLVRTRFDFRRRYGTLVLRPGVCLRAALRLACRTPAALGTEIGTAAASAPTA